VRVCVFAAEALAQYVATTRGGVDALTTISDASTLLLSTDPLTAQPDLTHAMGEWSELVARMCAQLLAAAAHDTRKFKRAEVDPVVHTGGTSVAGVQSQEEERGGVRGGGGCLRRQRSGRCVGGREAGGGGRRRGVGERAVLFGGMRSL